jgi:hypothetical protein
VDAFPRITVLERLRKATSDLVELLADDAARRAVDGSSLATAVPGTTAWDMVAIAGLTPLLVGVPLLLATFPTDALF